MEYIKKYIICIIGCCLTAIAMHGFIIPHHFVNGGFGGLAIALNKITSISIGTIVVVLNIPLFLLAYYKEGKEFVINGIISTILFGIITNYFEYVPMLCSDPLLSAIFGACLEGLGVGLCYKVRMTTGGVELLSRLLLHNIKRITPGYMMMLLSTIVIGISTVLIQSYHMIYYSIIEFFISGRVGDYVILYSDQAKMCQVITSYPEEVKTKFLEKTYRGMTQIKSEGCYSGEEKYVLMSILSHKQVQIFIDTVKEADPEAFVIISEANEVMGKGFKVLA